MTKSGDGTLSKYLLNSQEFEQSSLALFQYMKLLEKNSKKSLYEESNSEQLTSCSSKDLRHLDKLSYSDINHKFINTLD